MTRTTKPVEARRRGRGVTLRHMSTREKLDPKLHSAVERARSQARDRGELLDGPADLPSALSPAASAALADWVSDGDYDRAVAEIIADDPDLATQ